MKKTLLALAVAAVATSTAYAQATDTLKKIKDTGSITIGTRESSGALAFTLGDGKYAGFHTEMANRIVADLQKKLEELNAKFPAPPRANVKDFVDHIDYLVKKIGIEHVGISSDFDGGGGVDGWSDASETFNVTLELVRRGYTEEQIAKIWSGNLLRVMEEVRKVAKK